MESICLVADIEGHDGLWWQEPHGVGDLGHGQGWITGL